MKLTIFTQHGYTVLLWCISENFQAITLMQSDQLRTNVIKGLHKKRRLYIKNISNLIFQMKGLRKAVSQSLQLYSNWMTFKNRTFVRLSCKFQRSRLCYFALQPQIFFHRVNLFLGYCFVASCDANQVLLMLVNSRAVLIAKSFSLVTEKRY